MDLGRHCGPCGRGRARGGRAAASFKDGDIEGLSNTVGFAPARGPGRFRAQPAQAKAVEHGGKIAAGGNREDAGRQWRDRIR